MATKNHTSPGAQASQFANRKPGERTQEGSPSVTSQGIDSFAKTHQQKASTKAHLDHIASILRQAISLADVDLEDLKDTHSESLGEDQSRR